MRAVFNSPKASWTIRWSEDGGFVYAMTSFLLCYVSACPFLRCNLRQCGTLSHQDRKEQPAHDRHGSTEAAQRADVIARTCDGRSWILVFGGSAATPCRRPSQASGIARSTCHLAAETYGSRLSRPTICSSAASLRDADIAWATTETLEVSGMSSLSIRRSPSPAPCSAWSRSERMCASSAPLHVTSTVV